MQVLNTKATGDTLPASEWNQPMSELQNVITALGQSLTDSDLNQLGKAIAGYVGSGDAYIDGGSANAVTLSPITGLVAPPQYTDRMRVRYRKASTNTGAVTINVAGIGSLKLLDQFGADLLSGDLVNGVDYDAFYDLTIDGGNPGFIYNKPSTSANDLPRGYIDGFITSNNGTDAANDIDIAAGSAKDSANSTDMILASALGKQIDVAWAEGGTPGATAGGFPSLLSAGSPVNDTWYRVFIIKKASGQIDAGFDTSASAVNLLADATGYTEFRQVSWIRYGTATIIPYIQDGDDYVWDSPIVDLPPTATVAAPTPRTLTVPPDESCAANFMYRFYESSGRSATIYGLVTSPQQTATTPSASAHTLTVVDSTDLDQVIMNLSVRVDSSSQIRTEYDSVAAGETEDISTIGFNYPRGKQ